MYYITSRKLNPFISNPTKPLSVVVIAASILLGLLINTATAQSDNPEYGPNDRDKQVHDRDRATGDDTTADQGYNLAERAGDFARLRQHVDNMRRERDLARSQYDRARSRVLSDLQSDPRYEGALQAVSRARAKYHDRRDKVLATLEHNDDYQDAVNKAEAVQQQIDALHDDPAANAGKIAKLSKKKLRFDDKATTIRANLLDRDPRISDLRAELTEAVQTRNRIEDELLFRLRNHPDVETAQNRLMDTLSDLQDVRADAEAARAEYGVAREQYERDRDYADHVKPLYPYGYYGHYGRHHHPRHYYGGGDGAVLTPDSGKLRDTGGGAAPSIGGGGGLIDAD